LLYATIFHSLAGAVTGSVFKIRTLLLLLAFILIEAAMLSAVDVRVAAWWALVNVISVQFSYLAGIFARRTLERLDILFRPSKFLARGSRHLLR
jgi:hypothetical protein